MGVHIGIAFEYMFKILAPAPNVQCMTIMDLGGLSLSKAVSFDNLAILKAVGDVSNQCCCCGSRATLISDLIKLQPPHPLLDSDC